MSWFLIQSKGSVQGSDGRGGSGGLPTSYVILCAGDMFTTLVFCVFVCFFFLLIPFFCFRTFKSGFFPPLFGLFVSFVQNLSQLCFPGDSDSKESACNAGDPGLMPGLERSPGEGNGYPL